MLSLSELLHSNYCTYAPIYTISPFFVGLLELENSLPDFVTQPRIKAPKPKTVTKTGFTKRKYRQEKELKEIHSVIKENRTKEEEPPKALRFLQKIEKPIPRPPTPAVEVPSEEEEERELAVIFLQQVIRGRAMQNMVRLYTLIIYI